MFYKELGEPKTKALKALIDSYEQFLLDNYPNQSTLADKTKAFLSNILESKSYGIFDTVNVINVLTLIERSGLRKDIFIYKSERELYTKEYKISQYLPTKEFLAIDSFEIDDSFEEIFLPIVANEQKINITNETKTYRRLFFNENGLFLYALAKSTHTNESFRGYLDIKRMG